MLAGDGKFQGAPLEEILHLHRRDPGTVLELSRTAGEKEGGAPGPAPPLQDQRPWEFRNGGGASAELSAREGCGPGLGLLDGGEGH